MYLVEMDTDAAILQSSLTTVSKIKTHTPLTQQHKTPGKLSQRRPDDDPRPGSFWQRRINTSGKLGE